MPPKEFRFVESGARRRTSSSSSPSASICASTPCRPRLVPEPSPSKALSPPAGFGPSGRGNAGPIVLADVAANPKLVDHEDRWSVRARVSPHRPKSGEPAVRRWGMPLGLTVPAPMRPTGPRRPPPVRRGICVPPPSCFERLREAGRVVHLTRAGPGSGKDDPAAAPGSGRGAGPWPESAGLGWRSDPIRVDPQRASGSRWPTRCGGRHAAAELVKALTAAPNLELVGRRRADLLTEPGPPSTYRIWPRDRRPCTSCEWTETLKTAPSFPDDARRRQAFRFRARRAVTTLRLGLHRVRLEGEAHRNPSRQTCGSDWRNARSALFEAGRGVKTVRPSPADARRADRGLGGRAQAWRRLLVRFAVMPIPSISQLSSRGTEAHPSADYLLAEVLERQPDDVRQLLLRTSILEARVRAARGLSHGGPRPGRRSASCTNSRRQNAFRVLGGPRRGSWFRYPPPPCGTSCSSSCGEPRPASSARCTARPLSGSQRTNIPLEGNPPFPGWGRVGTRQGAPSCSKTALALQLDGQGAHHARAPGPVSAARCREPAPSSPCSRQADLVLRGFGRAGLRHRSESLPGRHRPWRRIGADASR